MLLLSLHLTLAVALRIKTRYISCFFRSFLQYLSQHFPRLSPLFAPNIHPWTRDLQFQLKWSKNPQRMDDTALCSLTLKWRMNLSFMKTITCSSSTRNALYLEQRLCNEQPCNLDETENILLLIDIIYTRLKPFLHDQISFEKFHVSNVFMTV